MEKKFKNGVLMLKLIATHTKKKKKSSVCFGFSVDTYNNSTEI